MNFTNRASMDIIQDYMTANNVNGCFKGGQGKTAEECWDTLEIMSGLEKPDKDEFIKKVNKRNIYYQMKDLRRKRDKLLLECDWTQSRDLTLTNDEVWKKYRQELRDLPQTITDIAGNKIEYPSKPI